MVNKGDPVVFYAAVQKSEVHLDATAPPGAGPGQEIQHPHKENVFVGYLSNRKYA